jgi:hypothetical protein
MAVTAVHIATVAAGLAILAAVHVDFWLIASRSPLKAAALAVGLAAVGALLVTAARTMS